MNGFSAPTVAWTIPILIIASVVAVSVLGWIVKPLQRALVLHPFSVRRSGHLHRL